MQVYIDGIIFEQQTYGGVSRIFQEILPRMCDEDEKLRFTLLSTGHLRQNLPVHANIAHKTLPPIDRLLQPGQFFWLQKQKIRALVQYFYIAKSDDKTWHSTYYTIPLKWRGTIVVTLYDFINEKYPDTFQSSLYKDFMKRKRQAVLSADAVICISQATKEDAVQFYPVTPNKLHVIYPAFSPIFKQIDGRKLVKKNNKPFFLYIGGRSDYKNFNQLLYTYNAWHNHNDVDLMVVGAAWTDAEQKQLMQLGVTQNVHLLDNVNDKQLCKLYNQASAFIYPSLYEGFGVPLLEAMACGCPIIASRIPSTLEIAMECPIYFDPSDTSTLIQAFDQAINESRDSERVKQGLDRVKNFSWEKTAEQTLKLYKTLQQNRIQ